MAGIKVKIGADASQFERTMKGVKGRLSALNVMVAGLVAFKALGASVRVAGDALRGFMDLVKEGEKAKTEEARLRNVVKQMGIYGSSAGKVADRLLEMADAIELLTGVDGEAITITQSKLATFRELLQTADQIDGSFDRATKAAIDLAATGFGSAESNAVMLGKALSDPERGLTALRRTGTLTTSQIEKIQEAFTKTGDRARYMADVLEAVEMQVKGAAEATANGTERMQKGWAQLRETIGRPLSDQFDKLAQRLIDQMPKLTKAAEEIGTAISNTIADIMQGDAKKLMAIGEFIGKVIALGVDVGFGATMRGIGSKTFQALDVPENAIRSATGLDKLIGQSDLGARMASANATVTGYEMQTAMNELAMEFAKLRENLANPNIIEAGGFRYRTADAGETSYFRDSQGRMLILMERIAENTSTPAFPK